jgi:hypothetical protein
MRSLLCGVYVCMCVRACVYVCVYVCVNVETMQNKQRNKTTKQNSLMKSIRIHSREILSQGFITSFILRHTISQNRVAVGSGFHAKLLNQFHQLSCRCDG